MQPENGLPEDVREHMRLVRDNVAPGFQADKTASSSHKHHRPHEHDPRPGPRFNLVNGYPFLVSAVRKCPTLFRPC